MVVTSQMTKDTHAGLWMSPQGPQPCLVGWASPTPRLSVPEGCAEEAEFTRGILVTFSSQNGTEAFHCLSGSQLLSAQGCHCSDLILLAGDPQVQLFESLFCCGSQRKEIAGNPTDIAFLKKRSQQAKPPFLPAPLPPHPTQTTNPGLGKGPMPGQG